MTPRKRSLSEYQSGADAARQPSFVDDERYRRTVLQLNPEADQTEEEIEAKLLDQARRLEIVTWDSDAPFSRLFEMIGAQIHPATSSSTSLRPPSTANASTAQIAVSSSSSTFVSSRGRVPSSRHSIVSSSTCPTFCTCNNEGKPTRSRSEKSRARYSFDPSHLRSESRDGRLKSGLKHALSRFPSFKKRSSLDLNAPPRASTCPECHNAQLPGVGYFEVAPEDAGLQEWESSTKALMMTPADEAAILRSLASPELSSLRSTQEKQKERHLAFRKELLEELAEVHRDILDRQRDQNKQSEEELANKHLARAARIEENQLSAELALIEDFKREKQALQSRIRHMEAYFRTPALLSEDDPGSTSDPKPSPRQYTQEQRDRLRQKYHERDSMDRLHESKIKVMRDRQAKQLEEAIHKMEREAAELAKENSRLYQEVEKRCQVEELATLAWLEMREKRLAAKWILEEAILRKKLELATNLTYGPLPLLSFEDTAGPHSEQTTFPHNENEH
ncbi:hypothetical protein VTO42DRAFT_6048 [Malbranchea cinnamomea]